MKKRFSEVQIEVQIIGFLREAEAGVAVKDLCRRHGFSEASYDLWRSKFSGMTVPDAKRLKALEQENTRLKKLLAEALLEQAVTQEVLRKQRVDRLYTEAHLQLRRRTRKKVPVGARQPLVRPDAANEVWSMEFVFDRSAEGRVIKCLTIVDDATHESVAIIPERTISGEQVTRILDQLAATRGRPQVIRTDNGKEFCGRAMLTWAHAHTVTLRLIEPGKPNQNAYIESFHGRFRDECLNEQWFLNLAHAQAVIEAWRRQEFPDSKRGCYSRWGT